MMTEAPSFTCPLCGKTSYHPEDVAQGYCNQCHAFTARCHGYLDCPLPPAEVFGNLAMCPDHAELLR